MWRTDGFYTKFFSGEHLKAVLIIHIYIFYWARTKTSVLCDINLILHTANFNCQFILYEILPNNRFL